MEAGKAIPITIEKNVADRTGKMVPMKVGVCMIGLGKQFKPGQLTTFKPYSKYPPCFKDIAFWIPDGFEPNDFFELGRAVAGELVEKVDLIDEFTNPKKAKTSHCYRITYRSMDRSLTDDEVNKMQEDLRERAANELAVELR